MGLFEDLSNALKPHADKLNDNLAFQSGLIHTKLQAIEHAVSDLGRGDIGDKWQRFIINRKFAKEEEFEVGTCPINEIWLIQGICVDGIFNKSPAFIVEAAEALIEAVLKEGIGFEGYGGNQVVLPGEELLILAHEEGIINCTITIIRKPYPTSKKTTQYGRDIDQYSHRNLHEIERDVIASKTDIYTEPVQEMDETRGREEIERQVLEKFGPSKESGR